MPNLSKDRILLAGLFSCIRLLQYASVLAIVEKEGFNLGWLCGLAFFVFLERFIILTEDAIV